MLATIAVGILSLLSVLVLWHLEMKRRFRSIAHIPGPKGIFLLGNVFDLGRDTTEILGNIADIMKKYGKWVQLWMGPNLPYLFVTDVNFMEHLLTSNVHIEKSPSYSFLKSLMGDGIFVTGGTKWRSRRKLITPAFHNQVLSYYVDVFNSVGDVLIEKLSVEVDKDSVDLVPLISLYTLDIICETTMGTSVNAQRNEDSEYVRAVHIVSTVVVERTFSAWKQFDIPYKISNSYKEEKKSLKILHDFTDSVIARRRVEVEREEAETMKNKAQSITNSAEEEPEEFDVLGIKSRCAFLDLLLRSSCDGQKLSDADVREEVDTFMAAGQDTTASALCFILYEIAQHPDVQEKLVEELRSVLADDKTRPLTFQNLNQSFKYMELVIKESLRLYPPAPIYGRELQEELNYDGFILPKGITLWIFVFGLHRDPELYPNPEKFIPERFEMAATKNRKPFSYIPFSAGLRNCIGQKFAMLLMKATLAKILRHFVLLPVPHHKLQLYLKISLKSTTGACVRLKKREDF